MLFLNREYKKYECMAVVVDVKTISNFQFDIFWTLDDINLISIYLLNKIEFLYLNIILLIE